MKMVKIADSATIRLSMPTLPREGSFHGVSLAGIDAGIALIDGTKPF
jgi:hypothetical protein